MADRELRHAERHARGREGAEALLRRRLRVGLLSSATAELLARLGEPTCARALGVRRADGHTPARWVAQFGANDRALAARLAFHAACWVYPLWEELGSQASVARWVPCSCGYCGWHDTLVETVVAPPVRDALDVAQEWLTAPGDGADCREVGERLLGMVRSDDDRLDTGLAVARSCAAVALAAGARHWRPWASEALENATRAAAIGWGFQLDAAWNHLREAVLAAVAGELLGL